MSTRLISMALFTHRNLAEAGLGLGLVRELLGHVTLPIDSFAFGPGFRRNRYTSDGFEKLQQELAERSADYAFHLWDETAQRAGLPTSFVRLSGRAGSFHQLMIDFPVALFVDRAQEEVIVSLLKQWLPRLDLISGYVHDADDFYFQNEPNPEVFLLSKRSLGGYRLKSIFRSLKREVDVERNPGHSHFVEGRMFTVAWLTLFGREMLELFGEASVQSADWESVDRVEDSLVARLYADPLAPESREKRERQAKVREQLHVDRIAHALVSQGPQIVGRLDVDFRGK